MRTIGFITSADHPNLAEDEQDLPAMLLQYGIIAEPVIWNDKNVNWNRYDYFIFRSSWDYFKKIRAFEQFLDFAEIEDLKIYNAVPTVRKNMDKHYLLELEKNNIRICPSVFLKKDRSYEIKSIMQQHKWDAVVIKPSISGTAYHTYKLSPAEAGNFQSEFNGLNKEHTFIMQQYLPVIETAGEKSLIYFHRIFSHAVLKTAKTGDFRVQGEFGGAFAAFEPSADERNFAEAVLATLSDELLYARVDFVTINDEHYLMELELFEPSLYLHSKEVKQRFAEAIAQLS